MTFPLLSRLSRLRHLAARLWHRLTEPHPAIVEPGQRSRARLLSAVLMGLTVVTIAYAIGSVAGIQPLARARFDQKTLLVLAGLAFLSLVYWLSRTRHYRWAVAFFVVATNFLMLAFIILAPDSALDTAWLLLSLIVCSFFFSPRATALLLAATSVSVVILDRFAFTPPWFDIVDAEIFLVTIGLLIVSVAALRQQDQRRLETQARSLADSEARMRASEEMYRTLVTQVNDGFYTCDPRGVLTFANPALVQMMGFEHPEQVVGKRFFEFVAPAMLKKVAGTFQQALESGQTGEVITVEVARPDGTNAVVEVKSSIIMEGGKVVGMRGVLRDITERAQAEEQLRLHARQMTLLNDMTRAALDTQDLSALLQTLANQVSELFEADDSYLTLWDEANERVIPAAASGPAGEAYSTLPAQPGEITVTASVLYAGQVLAVDDVFHSPYLSPRIAEQFSARSLLGLPLIADDKKLGAVLIAFNQPHHFAPDEVTLGEQVAGQIALAVARAQLNERVTHYAAELEQRVAERTAQLELTNRQLHQASDRLKFLVSANPAVIYTSRAEGDYGATFISDNVTAQLGYEPRDFVEDAEFWASHIHPEDAPRVFAEFPRLFEHGMHAHEYRFLHHDGTYRWMHDNIRLVRDADGNPTEIIGSWMDITARKQAEEDLRRAKDVAEHALAVREDFLARVSHELRTPLNAILGFAQVLEMGELGPRQQAHLQYILKAGRALLDLVNVLLDLTNFETGQMGLLLDPVAVSGVAQEAVDLMHPLAAARRIQLRAAEMPSGATVRADSHRLEQVLLNLLSNAIKYNRADGTVVVDCTACPNDQWRINVRDSGPGLSADQCARLFTSFDRFGTEYIPERGVGLGLVHAKQLVEAMSGTIGVDSILGEGSTFWVDLPRVESPASQCNEEEAAPVSVPTRTVLYSVLSIDNDPVNLKLLEQILVYRPETRLIAAMQGRLGLDLAREHQPDLILLDLNLPDLSGLQLLLTLRADPHTQEIPVVVIGADTTPHQIERLLAAGALAHLTKPMHVQKFLEILDKLSD